MRKLNKFLIAFLISILLIAIIPVPAQAAVGFTARPDLPYNQRDGVSAFFDLDVRPGQVQELSIILTNTDVVDIDIEMQATVAVTNSVGNVVYVAPGTVDYVPSLLITDMISFPSTEATIPQGEQREIAFTLTIPDVEFDGVLLGGIRLLRALTEEEATAEGVVNQFAVNVPIRLRQNDDEVSKEFYLRDAEADVVHFSASAIINIVNPQPRLFRDITLSAEIFPEGSDTPLLEFHSNNIAMAPESLMPLTITDLMIEGFEPGFYIAVVSMEHEGDVFNFEERFEVTAVDVQRMEEVMIPLEAPDIEEESEFPLWMLIVIIAGSVLLIAIIIIVIVLTKRMKKYKKMAEGETTQDN